MKTCAAFLILLGLGVGCVGSANAQVPSPPLMTIKIFNDDPDHYIFPVLTTGQGAVDIWLQAIFKVPQAQEPNNPYPRTKSFRIYITNTAGTTPVGIAPGQNVSITIPLYTQLAATVDPKQPNQYIDWWNGGTILLYSSTTATPPPRALLDDFTNRPSQQPVTSVASSPVFPTCPACQGLKFFSDDSDLPKADSSQLLEYTLGARVQLVVTNPKTDPSNTLDLQNVDFDVSYVNLAFMPATMGPFQNDQVGYVGTPQTIDTFTAALNKFLTDFPGWPQFVRTYPIPPTSETVLKLASPLEIFARLSPPSIHPPPDLTLPPHWPDQLWVPIQSLRTNWVTYAGKINSMGPCSEDEGSNNFCGAIVDVKALMLANFNNYKAIFPKQCGGTPITLTDDILISHVYGWAPFTESATAPGGCPPTANLLENTPGYSANNFAKYLLVKEEFDKLNYGTLPAPKYAFNPWVQLIHGQKYVNAPNVYAYSVDDAVGNIQAEGTGFIVDVGSTAHLENQLPAAPPINIAYAIGTQDIRFTSYRICSVNAPDKAVNPFFQSFIINANDPANCPIFFLDNKSQPQLYTFRITKPPPFTVFLNPANAKWTPETAAAIDCSGNAGPSPPPPNPQYRQSSQVWCCEALADDNGNGVFAYTTPEPHSAHQTQNHFAVTHIAEQSISNPNESCNMGKLPGSAHHGLR